MMIPKHSIATNHNFFRLLRHRTLQLYYFLLAIPLLFVLRITGIFITIRIGLLDSTRLGHFCTPEIYLIEKDNAQHPKRALDLFYHRGPACNKKLLQMWKRRLLFFPFGNLAYHVDWLNRQIPGYEKNIITIQSVSRKICPDIISLDSRWYQKNRPRLYWPKSQTEFVSLSHLFLNSKSHIELTDDEQHIGELFLQKLGISDSNPIACFHNRDSAYLNSWNPDADWSYHDYRDSRICNYELMAEDLARRGYFSIRVGSEVNERLNNSNERIVDYASDYGSDLLDIFLAYKCRFFVCTPCGINVLPLFFRKPTLTVNVVHLGSTPSHSHRDLLLLKSFWSISKNRELNLTEICSIKAKNLNTEYFHRSKIKLIENTPEELRDAAIEMDEKLNGSWIETRSDIQLQDKFWKILQDNGIYRPPKLCAASSFLRRHEAIIT